MDMSRSLLPSIFIILILFSLIGDLYAVDSTPGEQKSSDKDNASFCASLTNEPDSLSGGREQKIMRPFGWRRLGYDMKYVFTAPSRLEKKDLRNLLIFTGITVALYVERKDIREIVLRNKTDSRYNFYQTMRNSGKAAFPPAVSLLFFASGKIRENDYDLETAQIIMESFALSSLVSGVGSFILATERPDEGDEIRFFRSGGHGVSGDVTISSSVVFPIIDRYLKVKQDDGTGKKIYKYAGQVLLFSLPIFTAMQRMSADKHWAPDVFLGASIGLATGKMLSNAHRKDRSSNVDVSVSAGMITFTF